MDNPSKTAVIERDDPSPVTDNERDQELTTQVLDGIHGAERLSGFGRFATKMQNMFQGSQASQPSKSAAHLRAAPIMMSAGVLLLMATGLLFLFSKPESAVPGHFRQPMALSGADSKKRAVGSVDGAAAVSENQLVGGDTSAGAEQKKAGLQNGTGSRAGIPSVPPTTALNIPAQPGRQSQLQLPAGTEIVAHTTNAISSGLESPVVAVVDRNVELNDSVLVPQGARVVGYTAGAVKDRINVRFTSVLLPNNREITISGLALMKDGSAGLVGKVQGSVRPILSGAARIGSGAAVVATEFAGQSSGTNQPLRIFLLNALDLGSGRTQGSQPVPPVTFASATTDQSTPSEQSLVSAQTAYIQALEAQLADMRAALEGKQPNGQH